MSVPEPSDRTLQRSVPTWGDNGTRWNASLPVCGRQRGIGNSRVPEPSDRTPQRSVPTWGDNGTRWNASLPHLVWDGRLPCRPQLGMDIGRKKSMSELDHRSGAFKAGIGRCLLRKRRQKPKILAAHRHICSVNARVRVSPHSQPAGKSANLPG